MPIFFKTCIQLGAVAGRGVFALEPIPKGAVWWRAWSDQPPATPGDPIDIYTEETIKDYIASHSFEEVASMIHLSKHFMEGNILMHLRDGRGHVNHSFEPNSQAILDRQGDWKKMRAVAIKEIKEGEEILEDYSNFVKGSGTWVEEVINKYDRERLLLEDELGIKEKKDKWYDE